MIGNKWLAEFFMWFGYGEKYVPFCTTKNEVSILLLFSIFFGPIIIALWTIGILVWAFFKLIIFNVVKVLGKIISFIFSLDVFVFTSKAMNFSWNFVVENCAKYENVVVDKVVSETPKPEPEPVQTYREPACVCSCHSKQNNVPGITGDSSKPGLTGTVSNLKV